MLKIKLAAGQWLANITRKLRNNFYLYLATLFTLLVLLDVGGGSIKVKTCATKRLILW